MTNDNRVMVYEEKWRCFPEHYLLRNQGPLYSVSKLRVTIKRGWIMGMPVEIIVRKNCLTWRKSSPVHMSRDLMSNQTSTNSNWGSPVVHETHRGHSSVGSDWGGWLIPIEIFKNDPILMTNDHSLQLQWHSISCERHYFQLIPKQSHVWISIIYAGHHKSEYKMDQNYLYCHWKVAIWWDEEMIIYLQNIELYLSSTIHPERCF